MALAYHAIKHGQRQKCLGLLAFTIICAFGFLVIKDFEYPHKFHEGALPGKWYRFHEVTGPGANLYLPIYFLGTGLHAFHVIVGMRVLIWVMRASGRGSTARPTTCRSSWGAFTGTSSTWSGSSCSRCST